MRLPDTENVDMFNRFDTIYKCDGQTDGQNCRIAYWVAAKNCNIRAFLMYFKNVSQKKISLLIYESLFQRRINYIIIAFFCDFY